MYCCLGPGTDGAGDPGGVMLVGSGISDPGKGVSRVVDIVNLCTVSKVQPLQLNQLQFSIF